MYKIKHVPTGLYYQPHKHRGSNLSKRGKVYQTATHGLSSAFRSAKKHPTVAQRQLFFVFVERYSLIHREYEHAFTWEVSQGSYGQMKAETNVSDWVVEEIVEAKSTVRKSVVAVISNNVEDFQNFVKEYLHPNGISYKGLSSRRIETETSTYHCISDPLNYRGMSPDRVVVSTTAFRNKKYDEIIDICKIYLPIGQKIEYAL